MADKNKKQGFARRLQDFLASYQGKVMLNYAYSWGAAVVILGALFKLTHLPGANFMLFIGMGTEVLVFFISAFDRPFKSYKWESVFPNIKISGADYGNKKEEKTDENEAGLESNPMATVMQAQGMAGQPQGAGYAGQVIIGGQPVMSQQVGEKSCEGGLDAGTGVTPGMSAGISPVIIGGGGGFATVPGIEINEEMEEATKAYLEQLKEMTEALTRFVEQTHSMGQDAEQINTLNKNLTGINAIYEIQLRSISSQLATIDEINAQSRRMASQIDELNKVYARMLEAMTVNMKMNGTTNV